MRLRKVLTMALALMVLFSTMQLSVFAETEKTPNFIGEVTLENWNCEEYESMEDLAALPLTVTVASETVAEEYVSFALTYDDFGGFVAEAYDGSEQMSAIMENIFENRKAVEDAWLAEEITDEDYYAAVFDGYTVTLNLGEDCHWTAELFDGGVTTNEDFILEFEMGIDIFVGFYNGLVEEFGEEPIVLTEETRPETFEEFVLFAANLSSETEYESYEEALRDPDNGYTEEEIQELLAEVQAQDAILAEAKAAENEYPLNLYVIMSLCCDCPWYYQIGHCYMIEKDGELEEIDFVWEGEEDEWGDAYLKGEKGTIIRAEDYLKAEYNGTVEEYAGKAFEFAGCYDTWWTSMDEDWSESELQDNQFVLGNPEYDGLILAYVLKEEATELTVKIESEYVAGSGKDFVITGSGELKDFQHVLVDGKILDKKYYSVEEGSTIITLNAEYMDSLTPGEHTVQIVWTTGIAETKFVIQEGDTVDEPEVKDDAKAPVKSENAPKTGDDTPVGLYVALLATAVCAVIVLFVLKKKNKN